MGKKIRPWLLGGDRNREQRNIIWNMLGSTAYAFATLYLTAVTGNLAGEDAGGIFSFGFSVSQLLLSISYFGVRVYHQTDVPKNQDPGNGGVVSGYDFQEYFQVRIATCLLAVLLGAVYLFIKDFTPEKGAVVFLLICFKVADGFADVYEVEFQRNGRLYLSGKSAFFRTILSLAVYTVALWVTGSLVAACTAAVFAAAAGILAFDISVIGFVPYFGKPDFGRLLAVLRECSLIFLASFLETYILNASKYAMEALWDDSLVYSYTAIFLPTMAINLVAGYVIRPFLTGMVIKWERGARRAFAAEILKIAAVIGVLTIVALAAGYYFGPPVLGLICGTDVLPYRGALLVVVAGGSLFACVTLFYYVLVIFRKQKFLFSIYFLSFLVSLFLTPYLVGKAGVMGGAVAYFLEMALLLFLFGGYVCLCFWRGH